MMTDTASSSSAQPSHSGPPTKRQKGASTVSDLSIWYRLTAELFGRIAKFLSLKGFWVGGTHHSELHSFLSCVGRTCGPNTLSIIRRIYLTKNIHYPQWCKRMLLPLTSALDNRSNEHYANWKHNLYFWMDLNEDLWKQRTRGAQLATNVLTISLNKNVRDYFHGYHSYYSGHYVVVGSLEYVASEEDCRAVSNFTSGKVVIVAVNGNKTKEYASQDIVRKKIATYESRGQNITLSLRREEDLMFSFLPLVIELGLDRVLRFLVEKNGADPNLCIGFRLSQGAKPNTSPLPENVRYDGPMIYCAACQRDPACAKYLLSVVDSIPDSSLGRPGRFSLLLHAAGESPSQETFQAVLDHTVSTSRSPRNVFTTDAQSLERLGNTWSTAS